MKSIVVEAPDCTILMCECPLDNRLIEIVVFGDEGELPTAHIHIPLAALEELVRQYVKTSK